MLTDAFQGDLSNVLDLSFCRLKIVEEVSSLFLSLGRLWFSNEVDDLKEAQYSEEVRHVVWAARFCRHSCVEIAASLRPRSQWEKEEDAELNL